MTKKRKSDTLKEAIDATSGFAHEKGYTKELTWASPTGRNGDFSQLQKVEQIWDILLHMPAKGEYDKVCGEKEEFERENKRLRREIKEAKKTSKGPAMKLLSKQRELRKQLEKSLKESKKELDKLQAELILRKSEVLKSRSELEEEKSRRKTTMAANERLMRDNRKLRAGVSPEPLTAPAANQEQLKILQEQVAGLHKRLTQSVEVILPSAYVEKLSEFTKNPTIEEGYRLLKEFYDFRTKMGEAVAKRCVEGIQPLKTAMKEIAKRKIQEEHAKIQESLEKKEAEHKAEVARKEKEYKAALEVEKKRREGALHARLFEEYNKKREAAGLSLTKNTRGLFDTAN